MKNFISHVGASGGNDFPEDVQGGFHKALGLNWDPHSIKTAFHIFDAPGHGKDICPTGYDRWPFGSPDGHKIQDQMKQFAKMNVTFTAVKVNESCNAMIKVMEDCYSAAGLKMNVTDLAHACQTKSAAEVTKDFVKATSYILSVAVGGPAAGAAGKKAGKGGAIPAGKAKPLGPARWDEKKFEPGQHLSQTTYYNVTAIDGDRITVANQYGNLMYVSRDLIERMESGSHFAKEVPTNMTSLAELLQTVGDRVFTVKFKCQPNKDDV